MGLSFSRKIRFNVVTSWNLNFLKKETHHNAVRTSKLEFKVTQVLRPSPELKYKLS